MGFRSFKSVSTFLAALTLAAVLFSSVPAECKPINNNCNNAFGKFIDSISKMKAGAGFSFPKEIIPNEKNDSFKNCWMDTYAEKLGGALGKLIVNSQGDQNSGPKPKQIGEIINLIKNKMDNPDYKPAFKKFTMSLIGYLKKNDNITNHGFIKINGGDFPLEAKGENNYNQIDNLVNVLMAEPLKGQEGDDAEKSGTSAPEDNATVTPGDSVGKPANAAAQPSAVTDTEGTPSFSGQKPSQGAQSVQPERPTKALPPPAKKEPPLSKIWPKVVLFFALLSAAVIGIIAGMKFYKSKAKNQYRGDNGKRPPGKMGRGPGPTPARPIGNGARQVRMPVTTGGAYENTVRPLVVKKEIEAIGAGVTQPQMGTLDKDAKPIPAPAGGGTFQEPRAKFVGIQEWSNQVGNFNQTLQKHDAIIDGLKASLDENVKARRASEANLALARERLGAVEKAAKGALTAKQFQILFLRAEEKILQSQWEDFLHNSPEVAKMASTENTSEDAKFFRQKAINGLKMALEKIDDNLLNAYGAATQRLRAYYLRILWLDIISGLVADPFKPKTDEEEDKLDNQINVLRTFTHFLAVIQYSDQAEKLIEFSPKKWIRERFLGFADQLLKAYQVAVLEKREKMLQPARDLTLEILAHANLEPVAIELGRTAFDSNIHIARSTAKNAQFTDGCIVSVVRNGFRNTENNSIIQQPEVIVNKG